MANEVARDYAWLRDRAQNGDALSVQSSNIGSIMIRVLTAEKVNHVAILFWMDGGLFVAEMRLFGGFKIMPASDWFARNCKSTIWYNPAPEQVLTNPDLVKTEILKFRGRHYSIPTLVSVWVSQIIKRKTPNGLVCSTLIQRIWKKCGVVFQKTADPGDIVTKSGQSFLVAYRC